MAEETVSKAAQCEFDSHQGYQNNMTTRDSKPTVDMCYHKGSSGEPCGNIVKWKIKPEKAPPFKVCDIHLPWACTFSGTPAFVDVYQREDSTDKIKTGLQNG